MRQRRQRIYIAGLYGSGLRLRLARTRIRAMGHQCAAFWLDDAGGRDKPAAAAAVSASADLADINGCDLFILDTLDLDPYGGREVEYGYALARGIECWRVGEGRNIFHGGAVFKRDWEEALKDLRIVGVLDPGVLDPVETDVPAARGATCRTFAGGATRGPSAGKLDFEGFLHPAVLVRFAEYMHTHRTQSDGALRSSDNWQRGIPRTEYLKSLVRHVVDLWREHRRGPASLSSPHDALCAILFNAAGYLYEVLVEDGLATRPRSADGGA